MLLLGDKEIILNNSGTWSIERNLDNNTLCLSKDGQFLIHDHSDYVYKYCQPVCNYNPTSLLVLGLGLCLIPNFFSNKCNDIDVIENSTDLINLVTGNSFNNPSINIINDDAYTFTTSKTYDLIISDIHWFIDDNYENQKTTLVQHYNQNLNDGRQIFFYLDRQLVNKN